jgi:hypothetical protein
MAKSRQLFELRKRLFGHQLNEFRSEPYQWLLGGAVAAGVILIIGYVTFSVFFPLMSPEPANTKATHLLEWAFWINCFAAAVLSFQQMELWFRHRDVRILQNYPVDGTALFVDRCLTTLIHSGIFGIALLIFFAPTWMYFETGTAAVISLFTLLGPLSMGFFTTALHLTSGAQILKDGRGHKSGHHQMFLYAPGIGLAAAVVILLILKLTAGEVLKTPDDIRFITVFTIVILGTLASSLLVGLHYFRQSYQQLLAVFRELDTLSYQSLIDYRQNQRYRPEQSKHSLDRLVQVLGLQYRRKYYNSRILYFIAAGASGIAVGSSSELSKLMLVTIPMLPLILTFFIANYWKKLPALVMNQSFAKALPFKEGQTSTAVGIYALKESMLIAGLYALCFALAAFLGEAILTPHILELFAATLGTVAFGQIGMFAHMFREPYELSSMYVGKGILALLLLFTAFFSMMALAAFSIIGSGLLGFRLWSIYREDVQPQGGIS